MRSSMRAAAAAIAALQTGILVAAQDQTEIKAYPTEAPVYEEITTTYVTTCPCETEPPWPCEGGECPPEQYPPSYPPETITLTETTTYTEPGETVEKTSYITRTTTQSTTQTVIEPYNVTTTSVYTTTKYKPTTYYETIINNQTITDTATSTATVTDIYVSETTSISYITYPASTVTENGTTVIIPPQTLTTTVTERETIPTTIDRPVPYPTTVIETVISGTTSFITQTLDRPVPYPTTVFETVISGTTSLVTQSLDRTQLVTVMSDRLVPTTIVQPPSTFTTTISLPGTTFITTITESGTTSVSTVTQPGTISTQIITQPGSTFVNTVTIVQAGPTVVQTQPAQVIPGPANTVTVQAPPGTITVAPPPPVCSETGNIAVSDRAGCEGRDCRVEFQEGAAVHWSNYPLSEAPNLLTAITFIDRVKQRTCITTSCNTELFDQFYKTSLTACARPPCPSNTINCDCSIVVGPLVLADGQTTSVTQVDSSGWNLNLGPTATANDVGLCSAGGAQCITATSSALTTPVVYTGEVTIVNGTGGLAEYLLLPGISDYFPRGNPFGACTTAFLNSANGYGQRLKARQAAGPASVLNLWKGANNFPPVSETIFAQEANLPSPDAETTTAAAPTSTPAGTSEPDVTSPQPSSAPGSSPPTSENSGTSQPPVTQTVPSNSPTTEDGQTSEPSTPGTTGGGGVNTQSPLPGPTTSPSPGPDTSVLSSVVTDTSGAFSDGTFYLTNTVYYSMVQGPAGQDVLDAVSRIRAGASTVASSDFGAYVTSILGLNSTGVPADVSESASGTTSSAPAQNTTGAAPGQVAVSWTLVMAACFFTISLLV